MLGWGRGGKQHAADDDANGDDDQYDALAPDKKY